MLSSWSSHERSEADFFGLPVRKGEWYSRAVVAGDEVHIAGTTGYDYAKMAMPDDVAEQTRDIYGTFAKVMREAGGDLADIVRLRTFVTDVSYCDPVVTVQGEIFGAIRPAEADARLRRTDVSG
jgi:enamine deaminase RidA (YjgF/YER057c/UK114 family)